MLQKNKAFVHAKRTCECMMRFMRFPITKIIWSVIRFMRFGMHLFSLIIREIPCSQYFHNTFTKNPK